jgi:hypothetical protein
VYVARLPASGRGAQIGERAFADALALDGYAVFRPERHSLVEQLTVYSRAEHVVFAEGSAVLGCVLLPDLTAEVAVVARRRDPVRDVRTATDCFRGYGKDVLWIDAVGRQFSFGLESWDALAEIDWSFVSRALSDAGFVTPAFAVECSDAQLRNELRAFVRELLDEPRALDFFGACGEIHDAWSGPSHVRDPRTGRAV